MCFLKLKCIICVIYVHPYFFKLYTFVKWFIHTHTIEKNKTTNNFKFFIR